jgi:hypothetical protein
MSSLLDDTLSVPPRRPSFIAVHSSSRTRTVLTPALSAASELVCVARSDSPALESRTSRAVTITTTANTVEDHTVVSFGTP